MRAIAKGPEPASLTAHRQTPHCNYDNYPDKGALRNALVTEQRGICCYCMGRIRNGPATMKIEHWRSQSGHPAEQLTYRNLLGACLGGHGQPTQPPALRHAKGGPRPTVESGRPGAPHRKAAPIRGGWHIRPMTPTSTTNSMTSSISIFRSSRTTGRAFSMPCWTGGGARRQGSAEPVPRERFERERARHSDGAGDLAPFCQVAVVVAGSELARMAA